MQLSCIAAETRIGVRYLEALENEDVKVLPGAIFARSFARQYASYVGIDEREIEADVQELFQTEDILPLMDPSRPINGIHLEPLPELARAHNPVSKRLPWPVLGLAAAVAVCSGAYMGWQRIQEYWLALPAGGAAEAARNAPEKPPATPPPSEAPQAATVAPANVTAQQQAQEVPVPPGASQGMAVRIVASDKTWLSISANGKNVFSGILHPNEARSMTGVERARMVVGNAGGVDVLTDGKSIGPIGPPGHVRVVLLTPEGPQILRHDPVSTPRAD
ncbi:MAG: DUF4115 domain-containing protein [Acidobacteriia bacterium]|nr:DUF4115 domain-containing protein [Terriglobia bacterium]